MNTSATFAATVECAPAASFAQEHFGRAALGHKKRNACLVRVAEKICRHPGGTLPQKLANPTDYKAMDALMNRAEVTHASVLQSHREQTQERLRAARDVVLLLHDTTELDYSGLSIPELGPLGNGHGRGYLCHNTLAVDPQRKEVWGLAHQILHARVPAPPREGVKAKRERKSRESRLWSTAVTALGTPPPETTWIDVADRGADLFEFLATELRLGRRCLVRATHNRSIQVGQDGNGPAALLFAHLRTLPAAGTRQQRVFDRERGAERDVHLAVAFAAVAVQPPHVRRGDYDKQPIPAWGVRIWEPQPPRGSKPLEWFLVSLQPVTTLAEAWQTGEWYSCRYMVEELHKAMKTGCNIEVLQFETAQALQPMIALLSVVSVLLLNLREASRRPEAETRPATEVVGADYEAILRAWRYRQRTRN